MALVKQVKNNKVTADSWCGQEIQPSESYQLQESEWITWSTSSKVNIDIANGDLIVGNGETDLGVVAGLDHLRTRISGETVQTVASNIYGMQVDGPAPWTCSPGFSSSSSFQLTNRTDYPSPGMSESYTFKYLRGGWIKAINAEDGDWAEFSVADLDNLLGYGAGFCPKQYVVRKFIHKDEWIYLQEEAPGEIPVGLYLICTYHAIASGLDRTVLLDYDVKTKG